MTLEEEIKYMEMVAEENQRVVDTGIIYDDVTIDMLYCDDTEVIEEHLANYQMCAEKHRQLAEWLKDYKRLLEQESKWIPVTERLPEDTDVLVWERHYSYKAEDYVEGCNIGFYWNGSWLVNGGGKFEVLAWRPLPEPYKVESEESENERTSESQEV